jgi:membrane protease YdiL (CAAX protease family)
MKRTENKHFYLSSIFVVITLFCALEIRDIVKWAGLKIPGFPFPYGGSILDNLLSVLVVIAAAMILLRKSEKKTVEALGLNWNGFKGPLLVLIATIPCWIGLWMQGSLSKDIDVLSIVLPALLYPLSEELVFRGFGFIFTRQTLAWRFVPAILLQAIAFAAIHWLGAGADGGIAVQIFIITFFGSIAFAALNMLDSYTIWSGFVLHASLNAAWIVFTVSDTATFGWIGNLLRFSCAILAILLLSYAIPKKDKAVRSPAT